MSSCILRTDVQDKRLAGDELVLQAGVDALASGKTP